MSRSRRPPSKKSRNDLIEAVMLSGRVLGTNSIVFHQAVAHILGLSGSEIRCLEVITRQGKAASTPGQVAEITGLTTGAVTVMLDRLEKAGLLERSTDKADRRKKILVATRKAWQRLRPFYEPMSRDMFRFMSGFSQKELVFMDSLFVRLAEFWKGQTENVLSKE